MTERFRGAILAAVLTGAVGGVAGIAVDRTFFRSAESVKTPGGLWVSPKEGETTGYRVHFDADAYPTRRNIDPDVKEVDFTVSWEGRPGPWIVACKIQKTSLVGQYSCDWDPSKEKEKVPQGKLNISFDVFDSKGNVNQAPNGTRTITYQP